MLNGDKNFLRDNGNMFHVEIGMIDMIKGYEDIGLMENDEYKVYIEHGLAVITDLKTDSCLKFTYTYDQEELVSYICGIIQDCGF